MFVVGQLAQFLQNPGRVHWEAAKQVVRYLKGSKNLRLTYGGGKQRGIEVYSDADRASQDHRHAISGFAVLIDGGGRVLVFQKARTYNAIDDGSRVRRCNPRCQGTNLVPAIDC